MSARIEDVTDARTVPPSELASTHARADLHVHLNGAIPALVVRDILLDEGTALPPGFDASHDLLHRSPCESLATYLKPWLALRLLPKKRENLDRISDAVFAGFKANGLRFVEVRTSVLYLAKLQQCAPTEALARMIESTRWAAGRAGIRRGLILTVPRTGDGPEALRELIRAYEELGQPDDVVGLDLAGDEEIGYHPELPLLFRAAKDDFGFGITIHAGETGRPENVRDAVELFDADRVGHGTAAARDPAVMELLIERDVCVEVCPISNRLTGAISADEQHPLREFSQRGVPFVICSDNPAIHGRGLAEDQEAAIMEGLPVEELPKQLDIATRYTFLRGQL